MNRGKGSLSGKPTNAIALLALATGTFVACKTNLAITKFGDHAQTLSVLLPQVAAIPYTSCVARWTYAELAKPSRSFPDSAGATSQCQPDADARMRLNTEFSVLISYLTALSKLAAGNHSEAVALAQGISANSASLSGASPAVSGLAAALADAVLDGRTAHALHHAIDSADPHVQALCTGFQQQLARIPLLALDNQELELRALYADSLFATPSNRLLLYRDFDSQLLLIQQARNAAANCSTLMGTIAKAHAALLANRADPHSGTALARLLQHTSAVSEQVANLQAVLK